MGTALMPHEPTTSRKQLPFLDAGAVRTNPNAIVGQHLDAPICLRPSSGVFGISESGVSLTVTRSSPREIQGPYRLASPPPHRRGGTCRLQPSREVNELALRPLRRH